MKYLRVNFIKWEKLKNEYYTLDSSILSFYIVSKGEAEERENEKEVMENEGTDDLITMSEISKLGIKFFDGLKNIRQDNEELFDQFNIDPTNLISLVAQVKNHKPLNSSHFRFAKRIFKLIENSPQLVEEALQNSKFENTEIIDFKGIYDRVKPFLLENWKTIEGLQNARNIFEYKEFNNIKTVYQSIINPIKKINQQSLLKSYESLQKLGRFDLKI